METGDAVNHSVLAAERPEPMPTPQSLASLHGVHKRYGATLALDGLDLDVRRSELLAVLGPNGAGKSTAIGLMLGLQQPDSGQVRLFGQQPGSLSARQRVGVMMQEVALAPELRVHELIELTASYYPAPYSVEAVLELVRIAELASRPYRKLSGGQKRQVQFGMAICGRPQLLFLDEPTAGLDVQAREMMWSIIRQLVQRGCSVVLTTHYLEEAEALADRVAVVAKGRVIAGGSVAEMQRLVLRRHVSCRTAIPIERIRAWPEVESAQMEQDRVAIRTAHAETLVRRLLSSDAGLSDLDVRRAGLSAAFVELTQEAS